jgi:hypothetical protein
LKYGTENAEFEPDYKIVVTIHNLQLKLSMLIIQKLFSFWFCVLLSSLLFHTAVVGQLVTTHEKHLIVASSNYSDTINMGGFLDGENTLYSLIYSGGCDPDYAGFKKAFEPMRRLLIKNIGDKTINSPVITINGKKNWYSLDSWGQEIFQNRNSLKDSILNLWNTLVKSRIHYAPPNYDAYNMINMQVIYGYGTCDVVARNAVRALKYVGYDAESIFMPHHTIANLSLKDGEAVIDADMETFYLDYDNKTLVGFNTLVKDKYLISRTRHYGRVMPYDPGKNSLVSRKYYLLSGPKLFTGGKIPDYRFDLRPGEWISFSWNRSKSFIQQWDGFYSVPDLYTTDVIANGQIVLETSFDESILPELGVYLYGVKTGSKEHGTAKIYTDVDSAFIDIPVKSPFPVLESEIRFWMNSSCENDSIIIYISDDYWNWTRVGEAIYVSNGEESKLEISSALKYKVYGTSLPMAYNFYLRLSLHKSDISSFLGIDSVILSNTFQISRAFLPSLELGNNILNYTDQNDEGETLAEIFLEWQESLENTPPIYSMSPIFPEDGQIVDSLYFKFSWEPSYDPDGDQITEYEFMLSDQPGVEFPLSPNFHVYTSSMGPDLLNTFKVSEIGWLNSEEEYYWKVRAKDSRGAWSKWSETWSFIPRGVMQPRKLEYEVDGDTVFLRWENNGKGVKPDFFKIYGSDESDGFFPSFENLISTSSDTAFNLTISDTRRPLSFYRVSACTIDGQESLPSRYITVGDHNIFSSSRLVVPNSVFKLNLLPTRFYTPIYYFKEDTSFSSPQVEIKEMPEWLNCIADLSITGYPDEEICRRVLFDSLYNRIYLKVKDNMGVDYEYYLSLISSLDNRKPSIYLDNENCSANSLYTSYVATNDGDAQFGDRILYEILESPEWISFDQKNNILYLSGSPEQRYVGVNYITVRATDSFGESETRRLAIYVYADIEPTVYISPNPVSEISNVILRCSAECEAQLNLLSLSGVVVRSASVSIASAGTHRIDFRFDDLLPAIYILEVTFGSGMKGDRYYCWVTVAHKN